MPMKRRGFVKGLLVTPVVPLVAHQQPSTPAQPQNHAVPNPQPDREPPRPPAQPAKLATVQVDMAAQTSQRYFKPEEFAALEKLGELLMPPLKGKPGATEAGAAVFLDFLISESPKERQQLYRRGLEGLNASAHKHYKEPFGELDATQADAILKPLLVARPWADEMPSDPVQHFIAQVHGDLRTATVNSREWAESTTSNASGRRGFNQAIGLYWHPVDPVVKG